MFITDGKTLFTSDILKIMRKILSKNKLLCKPVKI